LKPASKAILVFAQSASRDARDKNLPGGQSIFDHLTRQTIQKALRTGFPVFHFDEQRQKGDSFGERLSRAMKSLFDKGIESLVVIGNDSPDLSTSVLRKTVSTLHPGTAVLGPSDDGGVYLIGLHRDQFEYREFLDLPWREPGLFQSMISWIRSGGSQHLVVLNYKMDLDSPKDFVNWSRTTGPIHQRVIRLIEGLFQAKTQVFSSGNLRFSQDYYPFIRYNKGSPVLFI
jgi:glycosyltransferase A (GT-A) superfamily protein (DUF2064 family)